MFIWRYAYVTYIQLCWNFQWKMHLGFQGVWLEVFDWDKCLKGKEF